MDQVLKSSSIDGVRARQHEEAIRVSLQKTLCVQARRWAHEARFWVQEELLAERHRARIAQHQVVRRLVMDESIADLGVHFNLGLHFTGSRTLTSSQSVAMLAAGRKLHAEVYNSLHETESAHEKLLLRLNLAEEVMRDWEEGGGWFRTQHRGDGLGLSAPD